MLRFVIFPSFRCQEWLTSLVEKSKAAGAKGARSKGPKGGKWTKEEVSLYFLQFLQSWDASGCRDVACKECA